MLFFSLFFSHDGEAMGACPATDSPDVAPSIAVALNQPRGQLDGVQLELVASSSITTKKEREKKEKGNFNKIVAGNKKFIVVSLFPSQRQSAVLLPPPFPHAPCLLLSSLFFLHFFRYLSFFFFLSFWGGGKERGREEEGGREEGIGSLPGADPAHVRLDAAAAGRADLPCRVGQTSRGPQASVLAERVQLLNDVGKVGVPTPVAFRARRKEKKRKKKENKEKRGRNFYLF
jgi:hypothetical protein